MNIYIVDKETWTKHQAKERMFDVFRGAKEYKDGLLMYDSYPQDIHSLKEQLLLKDPDLNIL